MEIINGKHHTFDWCGSMGSSPKPDAIRDCSLWLYQLIGESNQTGMHSFPHNYTRHIMCHHCTALHESTAEAEKLKSEFQTNPPCSDRRPCNPWRRSPFWYSSKGGLGGCAKNTSLFMPSANYFAFQRRFTYQNTNLLHNSQHKCPPPLDAALGHTQIAPSPMIHLFWAFLS